MLNNSIRHTRSDQPLDSFLLLTKSLQRTSTCFSLDRCMHSQKAIQDFVSSKNCALKKQLEEIGFEKEDEHFGNFYKKGKEQLSQLTEYYRYYTQSSIIYIPTFYKLMHSYREQHKAIEYNRLKVILDLSTSTHTDSSNTQKLDNTLASSFKLLSMLKITNSNQQSLLFQNLKDKLQKDYGPNQFNTLQEIDNQYCFSKTGSLTSSGQRLYTRGPSKRTVKIGKERDPLPLKTKVSGFRNSSCGMTSLNSTRKDSKGKINRRKHASMDNLNVLHRQSSIKKVKTQTKQNSQQMDIKRTIQGVKEQIRKQKAILIKRCLQSETKKTAVQKKIGKKVRQ